ncbi:SIS domain-containing protein, partial [Pelagibacteraceae bacterium]|nr:SIS domain-containing protein [Pelagibacteraceae bacterium]
MINKSFNEYKNSINSVLKNVSEKNLEQTIKTIKKTIKKNGKVYVIGNGGSASIASHVSVDFAKVAGVPSSTFN